MDGAGLESGTSLSPEHATRRHWMAVLARASVTELESALPAIEAALGALPAYRLIRKPEIGMTMVRGRAGGTGQAFNLGEMTMTRCTLRIEGGQVGTAYVAGRSQRQAELAALLDALLQDPRHQAQLIATIIDPLARAQEIRRNRRVERSAATKVDFFTVVRGEDRT
jgi:alpha-D-ribose 1-methylphosphonate 5-triphosphate synthase subunit PhnG